MLETTFPRFPGDIGNATTFEFPVRYKIVSGASLERVVFRADSTLLGPFIRAGKQLEQEGIQAITTSCGFLAMFQREMTKALSVPVFTSSLLQVPLIRRMIRPTQKIGILTASKPSLGRTHLESVGIQNLDEVVIAGMESEAAWQKWTRFRRGNLNMLRLEVEKAVVRVSRKMIRSSPEVAVIVFECTNLPPYADAVVRATARPVFDIVTLTRYVYGALVRNSFRGYM
jgi:hypothetical protein